MNVLFALFGILLILSGVRVTMRRWYFSWPIPGKRGQGFTKPHVMHGKAASFQGIYLILIGLFILITSLMNLN